MSDLTVPEARDKRNSLASRTDVLDKVGVLATLPDDMHATTEMVATFYEVGIEAIKSLVKDNRHEVSSDGYHVVVGDELRSLKNLSGIDSRTPSLALFPRRAVLRVGMLLRDSSVARRVRDYLLDTEQQKPAPFEIPRTLPAALRAYAAEVEAHERTRAELEQAAPAAAAWDALADAEGDYSLREAAQILSRDPEIDTGQNRLMVTIRELGMVDASGQPYQKHITHLRLRVTSYEHPHTGEPVLSKQIRVTALGVKYLHTKLGGVQPLRLIQPVRKDAS